MEQQFHTLMIINVLIIIIKHRRILYITYRLAWIYTRPITVRIGLY